MVTAGNGGRPSRDPGAAGGGRNGRLREEGDGDCGIAFEYAIHDAVLSRDASIAERIADALDKCQILRGDPTSILFATEKSGAQQLISTEPSLITDSSPVLLDEGGRPVGLREHLSAIGAAFRLPGALLNLAQSIRGLFYAGWKIVQALCAGDFKMPGSVDIPNPLYREVARIYVERRDFPIVDVVEAIGKFAQPELLTTSSQTVSDVPFATSALAATSTIISPSRAH